MPERERDTVHLWSSYKPFCMCIHIKGHNLFRFQSNYKIVFSRTPRRHSVRRLSYKIVNYIVIVSHWLKRLSAWNAVCKNILSSLWCHRKKKDLNKHLECIWVASLPSFLPSSILINNNTVLLPQSTSSSSFLSSY